MQNYEVLKQIGRGGFATVHRGRCRRTGRSVAIKMVRVVLPAIFANCSHGYVSMRVVHTCKDRQEEAHAEDETVGHDCPGYHGDRDPRPT